MRLPHGAYDQTDYGGHVMQPGYFPINSMRHPKVELTDNLNLKFTDDISGQYFFINLDDIEVKQFVDKINAYPAFRDARRAARAKEG